MTHEPAPFGEKAMLFMFGMYAVAFAIVALAIVGLVQVVRGI